MPKLHVVYDALTDYTSFLPALVLCPCFVLCLLAWLSYAFKAENMITRMLWRIAHEDAWTAAIGGTLFTGVLLYLRVSLATDQYAETKALY